MIRQAEPKVPLLRLSLAEGGWTCFWCGLSARASDIRACPSSLAAARQKHWVLCPEQPPEFKSEVRYGHHSDHKANRFVEAFLYLPAHRVVNCGSTGTRKCNVASTPHEPVTLFWPQGEYDRPMGISGRHTLLCVKCFAVRHSVAEFARIKEGCNAGTAEPRRQ